MAIAPLNTARDLGNISDKPVASFEGARSHYLTLKQQAVSRISRCHFSLPKNMDRLDGTRA